MIRIGPAPRPEFVEWRYGSRLPVEGTPGPGFWARLLSRLPAPPVEGYDPYRGVLGTVDRAPWLASPFMEAASPLTYLFSQVPLAPRCPSCRRPLVLRPWEFQRLRILQPARERRVLATCALCGVEVAVPLHDARPTLRLGLSLVTPPPVLHKVSDAAAQELDALGGPEGLLAELVADEPSLGDLDPQFLAGLLISLDEIAEAEALEAEWREAEELAAIMDGSLTEIPGFEAFRREILDEDA